MSVSIELDINTEDPGLVNLCEQYWAIEEDGRFIHSVSAIAREAKLSSHEVNKIVYANCDAYTLDDVCASCGGCRIYANRTDFAQRRREFESGREWICEDCKAAERERAAAAKREEEERQQAVVKERYAVKQHEFDLEDLTLRDAVFLIALLRHLAREDYRLILSLDSKESPVTPSRDYDHEVVKHLYRRGLITVDPDSPIEAFAFNEEDIPDKFYTGRVRWVLTANNESHETNIAFIRQVEQMFKEMAWNDGWEDEVVPLWREIALHECLAYLVLALEDHKLPFTPGEKTTQMFEQILEHFSISQIYSFIWRAAKDAAAFYTREQITKSHAANTVVGAIQRAAERAHANGWEVKHYGRDRRLPESVLNQVLFNRALQIGDEGFNSTPYWNLDFSFPEGNVVEEPSEDGPAESNQPT